MTRRFAALIAALPLALAACKTPEQKLVDRRRALRSTLDGVYADYRASAAEKPPEGGEGGLLGRVAGEVDRAWVESQCLAVGRGERAFGLSARLESFLAEDRNVRSCRKAADLQAEVDALEREVSAAQPGR